MSEIIYLEWFCTISLCNITISSIFSPFFVVLPDKKSESNFGTDSWTLDSEKILRNLKTFWSKKSIRSMSNRSSSLVDYYSSLIMDKRCYLFNYFAFLSYFAIKRTCPSSELFWESVPVFYAILQRF